MTDHDRSFGPFVDGIVPNTPVNPSRAMRMLDEWAAIMNLEEPRRAQPPSAWPAADARWSRPENDGNIRKAG